MISVRRVLSWSRDSSAPPLNFILRLRSYSTPTATATKSKSKPKPKPKPSSPSPSPKPTEIPFQPKLANAVNLIGQIHQPIQFQTSPDGNAWAATVITRQESPSSSLWIPVIFEGDLAHTAVCHLKQNDYIHIAGQLSTDPPHLQDQNQKAQSNFQVMVQSLNFVQDYPQVKYMSLASKQKACSLSESEEHDVNPSSKDIHSKQSEEHDIHPSRKDNHSKHSEEHDIDKSWKDLLSNPDEWWEVLLAKENPKGAAFERKTNGELLFIDSSTPKWLQEKLESITIDLKPEPKHSITSAKNNPASLLSHWRDLLLDPKQWFDFRDSKLNGLVSQRHPDFKRKDGSVSLWCNQAPNWIFPKLKGVDFVTPVVKSKQAKDCKGDQSWNDLVQNPDNWWDNRLNKRNARGPDFKHKETGEGLWLQSSPSWVLPKLPPVKPDQSIVTSKQESNTGFMSIGREAENEVI